MSKENSGALRFSGKKSRKTFWYIFTTHRLMYFCRVLTLFKAQICIWEINLPFSASRTRNDSNWMSEKDPLWLVKRDAQYIDNICRSDDKSIQMMNFSAFNWNSCLVLHTIWHYYAGFSTDFRVRKWIQH